MATRPNIKLTAGIDNDVYALLNAQVGQPSVTVGDTLIVQNKSPINVYLHEGAASYEINGGTTTPTDWQVTLDDGANGIIATCSGKGAVINVQVVTE